MTRWNIVNCFCHLFSIFFMLKENVWKIKRISCCTLTIWLAWKWYLYLKCFTNEFLFCIILRVVSWKIAENKTMIQNTIITVCLEISCKWIWHKFPNGVPIIKLNKAIIPKVVLHFEIKSFIHFIWNDLYRSSIKRSWYC